MKRRANNLRVWASLAAVCIVILGALGADNTGLAQGQQKTKLAPPTVFLPFPYSLGMV